VTFVTSLRYGPHKYEGVSRESSGFAPAHGGHHEGGADGRALVTPSARPAQPATTAAVGAAVLWWVSQVRGRLRRTLRTAGPVRSCGPLEAGLRRRSRCSFHTPAAGTCPEAWQQLVLSEPVVIDVDSHMNDPDQTRQNVCRLTDRNRQPDMRLP
jgi:hypothetical protein